MLVFHDRAGGWVSEVYVSTDVRCACSRGVIASTMGAYPRGTGSNPVEGMGTFFPHAVSSIFVFLWHTHTHTHTHTHQRYRFESRRGEWHFCHSCCQLYLSSFFLSLSLSHTHTNFSFFFCKGTTFFICVSRPAHALISASGEKKKKKPKKIQRKCVPLDKFARTSTVLNSRRERDRSLDANNSIMETDGESKFVSLFQSCSWRYIALQNESGSRRSRLPGVSLLLEHWSSWGTHQWFRDQSPRRHP